MTENKQLKSSRMDVAKGIEPAELVLKNGNIVNVFTGRIESLDIAIHEGIIVGVGQYSGKKEIDCTGKYLCPGFIDGHVHIESSLLTPSGFARAVMPKGTTTIIADPHEVANVCGSEGIHYMLEAAKKSPLDVYIMLPSCVPSTEFEHSGATLRAEDLVHYKNKEKVIGLGEMMNYPGVLEGDCSVHQKLEAFSDQRIDGHAPALSGCELNSYILSGVTTDHECSSVEELEEKVAKGMYVHLREGSATRDLGELCKGVTEYTSRRLLLCTDDKHLTDIEEEGHINYNVKLALAFGIDPIVAIQMATINVAECYGLKNKGAIAPGFEADIVVFSDFEDFTITDVYKKGVHVARDNQPLFKRDNYISEKVKNTVHLDINEDIDFRIPLNSHHVYVIGTEPDSIITKKLIKKVTIEDGYFAFGDEDVLKVAVIERHKRTGNVGLALVQGFGLQGGAIGLTIAHDSHNMIVIGDSDEDMSIASRELVKMQGGIVIVQNGKVKESLQLEIAGLMTDASIEEVTAKMKSLEKYTREMGVPEGIDPFLSLPFLALPVIPEVKVTDRGLFDVEAFKVLDIEVGETI